MSNNGTINRVASAGIKCIAFKCENCLVWQHYPLTTLTTEEPLSEASAEMVKAGWRVQLSGGVICPLCQVLPTFDLSEH